MEHARYNGHRIEVLDGWDPDLKRPNRVVLGVGASLFRLRRRRQEEVHTEIREWWLGHREDWPPPIEPPPRFRFLRHPGPATPPAHG